MVRLKRDFSVKKPHYLILANVMLKQDNMSTVAELVALSGFDFSQVDSQITTLKFRSEYRLLVDKRGKKHKYGLKIAGGERGRDFVTELSQDELKELLSYLGIF